MANCNCNRYCR